MEFNPEGLGHFLERLFVRHSTNSHESDVEQMGITNPTGTHEQQPITLDDNNANTNDDNRTTKRFCLIIFNDPTLSELFKTKPGQRQQKVNLLYLFLSIKIYSILSLIFRSIEHNKHNMRLAEFQQQQQQQLNK